MDLLAANAGKSGLNFHLCNVVHSGDSRGGLSLVVSQQMVQSALLWQLTLM
jgi:hypothetical protein